MFAPMSATLGIKHPCQYMQVGCRDDCPNSCRVIPQGIIPRTKGIDDSGERPNHLFFFFQWHAYLRSEVIVSKL